MHGRPLSDHHYLRALSYRFPSVNAALNEIAHLRSVLELPKGSTHILSDVHGEYKKLNHILRNGSGSLRPLVEKLFTGRISPEEQQRLLQVIYYPRETFEYLYPSLQSNHNRQSFLRQSIYQVFEVMRALASRYTLRQAERVFPMEHRTTFQELLYGAAVGRSTGCTDALINAYIDNDGGVQLLQMASRAVRAFSVFELIVAGDLGDRGPRIDHIFSALRNEHNVTITWGNHDIEWLGASLGQQALIATVLRISLRYGRISQLEEGYGIPVEPIEQLVHTVYSNDNAQRFKPKGEDLRDPLLLSRMQKAMAVIQFKLEGQTITRNPHFALEQRNLLHRIDPARESVVLNGTVHPLLDSSFPTIDWQDPYALNDAEQRCINAMTAAFRESSSLANDMSFLVQNGTMYTTRDHHLVFHGCVPVDESGGFLSVQCGDNAPTGRALFDEFEKIVRRAHRHRHEADLDWLYYLWAGPVSPLFGKDKMATFESYFIEDKHTHHETKNPYFRHIHNPEFCKTIASEFDCDPDQTLIINGHVPVKLEQGESPLKRSNMAVTIDGAFSEAYGDKGYTLILDADCTYLAQHHHFESVQHSIETGSDIVPMIQRLRAYPATRLVRDTPKGQEILEEIQGLERLIQAYMQREITPPVPVYIPT